MKERGGALVETALVIPLWIILCFGLVDLSRMIKVYAAVDHAAQEAVMRGASFQCSMDHATQVITACNTSLPLPADSGRREFIDSPTSGEYVACLNNNSGPDCGRIIMAYSARLIVTSMSPKSVLSTTVAVEIVHNSKYSRVEVAASFTPLFKILGPQTVRAVSVGPYGMTVM